MKRKQIYEDGSTDLFLLIDVFNSMNRAVGLHNVQITCPSIAKYLINAYRHPARLFIAGGVEIPSIEGTTQGDPLSMSWYPLTTVNIITDLCRHKYG